MVCVSLWRDICLKFCVSVKCHNPLSGAGWDLTPRAIRSDELWLWGENWVILSLALGPFSSLHWTSGPPKLRRCAELSGDPESVNTTLGPTLNTQKYYSNGIFYKKMLWERWCCAEWLQSSYFTIPQKRKCQQKCKMMKFLNIMKCQNSIYILWLMSVCVNIFTEPRLIPSQLFIVDCTNIK